MTKKLGSSIPIIVAVANGIIGRDALTDELKEVEYQSTFVFYPPGFRVLSRLIRMELDPIWFNLLISLHLGNFKVSEKMKRGVSLTSEAHGDNFTLEKCLNENSRGFNDRGSGFNPDQTLFSIYITQFVKSSLNPQLFM